MKKAITNPGVKLLWTAMVIMLHLFPVSMADHFPPETDKYPLEGFCQQGEWYNYEKNQCEPCAVGTYQTAESHQNRYCKRCRKPEVVLMEHPRLMLDKPCTKVSDTTFKCWPGFYSAGYENQHAGAELPSCRQCVESSNTFPECAGHMSTTAKTVQSSVDPGAVDDDRLDVNGSALCNGSSLAQCDDGGIVRNNDTAPCNRSFPGQCNGGESHEEHSTSDCGTRITCIVPIAMSAVVVIGGIIACICVVIRKRKSAAKKRDGELGIIDDLIDHQKAGQDTYEMEDIIKK